MPNSVSIGPSDNSSSTSTELSLGTVTRRDNFIDAAVSEEKLQSALNGIASNVFLKKDSNIDDSIVKHLLSLHLIENWMNNDILLAEVTDHLSQLSAKHNLDIAHLTLIAISHAMTLPQANDPAARRRLLRVIQHVEDIQEGEQLFNDYCQHGLLPNQISVEMIKEIKTMFAEAAVAMQQQLTKAECKAIIYEACTNVTFRNQELITSINSDDNDDPNELYWQSIKDRIKEALDKLTNQRAADHEPEVDARPEWKIKSDNKRIGGLSAYYAERVMMKCFYDTIYQDKLYAYLEHQHIGLLSQPARVSECNSYHKVVDDFKNMIHDYLLSGESTNPVQKINKKMNSYGQMAPFHDEVKALRPETLDSASVTSIADAWTSQRSILNAPKHMRESVRVLSFRALLMSRTLQMRTRGEHYVRFVADYVKQIHEARKAKYDAIEQLETKIITLNNEIDQLRSRHNDSLANNEDHQKPQRKLWRAEIKKLRAQLSKTESTKSHYAKQTERLSARLEIDYNTIPELLNIQFCHGTNTATLHNMALTDFRLIPTGRLLKLGVIPTQGEQWEGTMGSTGVNTSNLSGTTLVGANRTIVYSHCNHSNHKTVLNQLKAQSDYYLGDDESRLQMPTAELRELWVFARNIRSLRCIAQDNYRPELERATLAIKRIVAAIERYRQSPTYQSCKSQQHVDEYRDLSLALQSAITSDIQAPHTLDYLDDTIIPVVLASKSFLQQKYGDYESTAHRSLKLGDDIQYLFTKPEHIDTCKTWLTEHGFDETVTVYSFDELSAAIAVEKLIAHSIYRLYPDNLLEKVRAKTLNANDRLSSGEEDSYDSDSESEVDSIDKELIESFRALSILNSKDSGATREDTIRHEPLVSCRDAKC